MNRYTFSRRTVLGLMGLGMIGASTSAWPQNTLQKVQSQKVIRVGYANEAPFSFTTAAGEFTGESPSVFKHVMKQLGVQEVQGVLTEFASLIPGLRAGRFDAIVASMYITPQRCKQIIFANPTYGVGESFVVKVGNPQRVSSYAQAVAQDLKIAFVAGTAEIEHGRLAGMSRQRQMIVPDFAAAVAAVKSGRAGAAVFTAITAKDLVSKDRTLEATPPFDFTHEGKVLRGEGSFGFRPEDTALRDAVNQELAKFIGTQEHLALVAPFGFDRSNLPQKTAEQLCQGQ